MDSPAVSGVGIGTPVVQVNDGQFDPSNGNSGLSREFVDGITRIGQEDIDSGLASADSSAYEIGLSGLLSNLPIIVNVSSYDFDFAE